MPSNLEVSIAKGQPIQVMEYFMTLHLLHSSAGAL